jgi:hypothetical protein
MYYTYPVHVSGCVHTIHAESVTLVEKFRKRIPSNLILKKLYSFFINYFENSNNTNNLKKRRNYEVLTMRWW